MNCGRLHIFFSSFSALLSALLISLSVSCGEKQDKSVEIFGFRVSDKIVAFIAKNNTQTKIKHVMVSYNDFQNCQIDELNPGSMAIGEDEYLLTKPSNEVKMDNSIRVYYYDGTDKYIQKPFWNPELQNSYKIIKDQMVLAEENRQKAEKERIRQESLKYKDLITIHYDDCYFFDTGFVKQRITCNSNDTLKSLMLSGVATDILGTTWAVLVSAIDLPPHSSGYIEGKNYITTRIKSISWVSYTFKGQDGKDITVMLENI